MSQRWNPSYSWPSCRIPSLFLVVPQFPHFLFHCFLLFILFCIQLSFYFYGGALAHLFIFPSLLVLLDLVRCGGVLDYVPALPSSAGLPCRFPRLVLSQ
jgi:membrane-anchored protein YejM (alkaline phosphatase superfamily)